MKKGREDMAAIIFKCPNCGGDLRFEPEGQDFKCEYCLSEFSKEQISEAAGGHPVPEPYGQGLHGGKPDVSDSGEESRVSLYSCPSCGAEIVAEETTSATFCYFCHNPVVLAEKLKGRYHPDQILPFAIDRDKAMDIFGKWISRKKYVPKAFYSREQVEKMTGVYFPYWLYGCQVEGKLEAEGIRRKTWVSGSTQFTRTEKYDISRDGVMDINHVSRNALSKANRKLAEGVMPFETDKLQPFHMGYLSGFIAENRDLEREQFDQEVEAEVRQFAGDSLSSGLAGYDSVQIRSKEAHIIHPKWQYVLMPVWTLTYKEEKTGKIYYFACNGQTGKVCGQLPVDFGRLAFLFIEVFMPVLAALLLAGYFL